MCFKIVWLCIRSSNRCWQMLAMTWNIKSSTYASQLSDYTDFLFVDDVFFSVSFFFLILAFPYRIDQFLAEA